MKLTPEKEEEVRLAWNKQSEFQYDAREWKQIISDYPGKLPGLIRNWRLRFLAAKGWDKEGNE